MNAEEKRLEDNTSKKTYWKKWGPYLAERQWGTVREDYSEDGDAWNYFTYDMARSRAYRWGEDGIGGICDTHQRLCFAFTFWNENDSHIKERIFGLSNTQGNHGEDVKDYFYYLDSTPTHSYMKYLYKYPHEAFPYQDLLEKNQSLDQAAREYELIDTGVFEEDKYFDIFIEYAKDSAEDVYLYLTIKNRSAKPKKLHVLPKLWFRNTWSWEKDAIKPQMALGMSGKDFVSIVADHKTLGEYTLYAPTPKATLFTENETNPYPESEEVASGYYKDAFHRYLVEGQEKAVNPDLKGTEASLHYEFDLEPFGEAKLALRLTNQNAQKKPLNHTKKIYKERLQDADDYYDKLLPKELSDDHRLIERQALSGMLWSKQFYHYVISQWERGDPFVSERPLERKISRNLDWQHLYNDDILSVPDKWEYPWFAAWDLAFHTLAYSLVDTAFAKRQLTLLTREWYMHPNGQLPAYEWNFDDINPPVHAWAAWRVYKMENKYQNLADSHFLESIFQKLLMNFTWWVNREDESGRNIFKGGFLGLDNISVFNRSAQIPAEGILYQSDATSWMGMYCLNMLTIALELAEHNPAYEDMASKFYEHFLYIARAINLEGEEVPSLWDDEDGFYYDLVMFPDGSSKQLKVKSLVGLMPLLSVTTIDEEHLNKFEGFSKRVHWFLENRKDLCASLACLRTPGVKNRKILSMLSKEKLLKLLKVMLSEDEFLSQYGIRAIAKSHGENPFSLKIDGHSYCVDYEPGESTNKLFGGNSNWRGPIWMPMNILIIEALQKYHHYYGEDFKVECPTGSGNYCDLWEVSQEISRRLVNIYSKDQNGRRAVFGDKDKFQKDPNFNDYLFFHEYFHGCTGEGLGASHQTGWTGCIAKLIHQLGLHKGFILD